MSPPPAHRSSLLVVLAVVLAGIAGVVAYNAWAAEDVSEVFPAGGAAGDAPAGEVEPPPLTARRGQVDARVELRIETLARALRPRPALPVCELVTGREDKGLVGSYVAGLAANPLARGVKGTQLVHFRLAGGRDYYRIVRLQVGMAAGERLRLPAGTATSTGGRVVDERGQPVADAKVFLAGVETTTDAAGTFLIEAIPAESGMPFVVRKPGHAALYRILSKSQYDTLHLHPIALGPGTRLRVRFLNSGPSRPRLYVLPVGGRDSRLLDYPFFAQGIHPVPVTDDGNAVFDSLPRGVSVRVLALHPASEPVLSQEIRLRGADNAVVLRGAKRDVLRGVVRGTDGQPMAGAVLTSRPAEFGLSLFDTGWLLPPSAYVRDAAVVRTAATGEFSLPVLPDAQGRGLLTVERVGMQGLEYDLGADEDPGRVADIVLHPLADFGRPRLLIDAGEATAGSDRLGGLVEIVVRDAAGEHGPYPWSTAEPFALALRQRSLVRVSVAVGGAAPELYGPLLVVGDHGLSVSR